MANKYVVIMAGGRGERFWPKSRLKKPKHLLSIVGDAPMLQQTIDRVKSLVPLENIFVITNRTQEAEVREICHELNAAQIIAEPMGRDTAAAVGLAMLLVKQKDPNAVFAMLPADHVIHDQKEFIASLETAFQATLKEPILATLGIEPTHPATGYGYIKKGSVWGNVDGVTVYKVERFSEKPTLGTAKQYIETGDYFWNAGMFVWTVPSLDSALQEHCPEIYQPFDSMYLRLQKGETLDSLLEESYPKLPRISIDYAVMEKADNIVVIPTSFDWDDIGEWPSIARHFPKDAENNVVHGKAVLQKSHDNIVMSENGHVIALVDVDNLVVVHTKDATLVCPKEKAQDIKALVKQMNDNPDYHHLL